MKGFSGFPGGDLPTVPVPEAFFTELLPIIDHAGELKVTVYAFWRLSRMTRKPAYLRREDFADDTDLMRGLVASPRQAQEALDDALERAEARGTFLRAQIEDAQTVHDLFFLNTPAGQAALDGLIRGAWRPDDAAGKLTLSHVRSNVFVLYEQNIGPLTPMIAESLRDAMATYPGEWIEDAIKIAVRNNARKLNYILAVLDRMKREGRRDKGDQTGSEDNLSRYDGYLKG
jgi:DnaD/phage-associated family protein